MGYKSFKCEMCDKETVRTSSLQRFCAMCSKINNKNRVKEYMRGYYQDHREEHDKTTNEWAKTHPDYQKDYYSEHREQEISDSCDYQKRCPEKVQANHSLWHHNRRMRAFQLLGGKCVRCGEPDFRCLQIDHINGGGKKHFEQRGTINLLSDVLKDPDVKSKYQLLCANCNWKKRYDNKEHGGHPINRNL